MKILDNIRKKITDSISDYEKKRMDKFYYARERILSKIIKKEKITESKIKSYKILITFFGCGNLRYGSGTLASFVTLLIWLGISLFFYNNNIAVFYETLFWLTISIIFFIYGIIFIPLYERHLNTHDHSSIVIDEVVGQILSLCLTYPFVKKYYFNEYLPINQLIMFGHLILSFIVFRFFDISKPFFIGWIDRNVKGSFGVMFDDLVCGLMTAAINIFIFEICTIAIAKLHNL